MISGPSTGTSTQPRSRSRSRSVTHKDGRTATGREVYAIDSDGKETQALRYCVGDLAFLG